MEYQLEKAVKRLQWRLSNDDKGNKKMFKVDNKDVDAFNSILRYVNQSKKETLKNNVLFAKLYIYELNMNIRKYETTALNEFPSQNLVKLFRTPLNLFFEAFHTDLHHNQLNKLNKYNDTNLEIDKKIEDIRRGNTILESCIINKYKNIDGYIKKLENDKITELQQNEIISDYFNYKKTFTLEFVTDKLMQDITDSLTRFSDPTETDYKKI